MRGPPEGVAEHGAVEHGASFETFFDTEGHACSGRFASLPATEGRLRS
jgi:hypothetical protein